MSNTKTLPLEDIFGVSKIWLCYLHWKGNEINNEFISPEIQNWNFGFGSKLSHENFIFDNGIM